MKRLKKLTTLLLVVMLAFALLPVGSAMAEDISDTVGPLTSAVAVTPNPVILLGSAVLTATVDDTTTGGSNILSAEYSLNGGAWTAMAAVDGAYDTPTEAVNASFKVTQIGVNQVCVRGTDVLNNVGEPVCTSLSAQYNFKGFFAPIRMGKDNKANAPQTIPVKWKLTTANGKPVKDKASFVAVMSYAVDCTTLLGDSASAVKESAPGKSGLKYNGGGQWHFNWKTPKAYRGTCRIMFVALNGGQMSPTVLFRFK